MVHFARAAASGRSSELRQSRTLDVRSTLRSSEYRIFTDQGSFRCQSIYMFFLHLRTTLGLENSVLE
ncbi:hypothetical protein I3842_13G129000 [Carya illinoinensis]|uniref:Uncharacterized protein n=1 Tax=Carya illinoinensis TaxID=32201 RepID=A0A922DCH7_CARIL|nr:hypothetical protein I3842_13G129000 [Carya illinoinensis]